MKRTLITGGSGFIGRNLQEHLAAKSYELFAPSHSALDLLDETAVLRFVERNDIDNIVHGANVSGNRKNVMVDSVQKNLRMFHNISRCEPLVEKIIHLGTGVEYDKRNYIPRLTEDYFDSFVPVDDYGFAKYCMSKYALRSEKTTVLRFFGVYGKYEDPEYKFVSNAIVKNLMHIPIEIQQDAVYDYICVEDVSRLIEKFLEIRPKFRTYNAVTGTLITLKDIVKMVVGITGIESVISTANPGMNREYSARNDRMMAEIGEFEFTPHNIYISNLIDYTKGILSTIDREIIVKDPYASRCDIRKI